MRLYKQYAVIPRLLKIAGESGDVQLYYWDKNEICSDDVVFDTSTDAGESIAQRRTMLMDLIKQGLLFDDDGKFTHSTRKRCLDLLGFGMWEDGVDLTTLHINKAKEENLEVLKNEINVLSVDNHKIHIDEHVAFLIGSEIKNMQNRNKIEEKILSHIEQHKKLLQAEKKELNKGDE